MTATLNYDLRNGLEFGTDEMGQANLKMILDFVAETWVDTLILAAKAQRAGMTDKVNISVEVLSQVAFEQLRKQDEDAAQLWNASWINIVEDGKFVAFVLKNGDGTIKVDADSLEDGEHVAELELFFDVERALELMA